MVYNKPMRKLNNLNHVILLTFLILLSSILTADPLVQTVTVTTTPTQLSSLLTFPTGQKHFVREYMVQVSPTSANPIRFGTCPTTCTVPVSSSNGIELAAGQSLRSMPGQGSVSIDLDKLGLVGIGGSATVNILVEYGSK